MESRAVDLLLVEVDPGVAMPLVAALRDLGHRVAVAGDAPAALRALDGDAHDALLLGWGSSGLDGEALLRGLRAEGITLPIVALGAQGRPADGVAALRLGADDHLARPIAVEELDARLAAILRGRRWGGRGAGDTIRAGDIVVSPGRVRAWRNGAPLDLGPTEFGLLRELARDAGLVVTRAALLERVWAGDRAPAAGALDTYVCRLRARLALPGRPDPIVTRRGIGYMLRA